MVIGIEEQFAMVARVRLDPIEVEARRLHATEIMSWLLWDKNPENICISEELRQDYLKKAAKKLGLPLPRIRT